MKLIKVCYYDWGDNKPTDFPIIQYPKTQANNIEYSGFYTNQVLNLYSDVMKSKKIGKINWSQNYLIETDLKNSTSQDFDQETVMLVFEDGNILFNSIRTYDKITNGFLRDTNRYMNNIIQGTGKYVNLRGKIAYQRLSLNNELRKIEIYKECKCCH